MKTKLVSLVSAVTFILGGIAFAQSPEADKRAIEEICLAKARQNIETYRKGDAVLGFKDRAGRPITGLRVKIEQVSQDFLFGALSDSAMSQKWSPQEVERFRDLFLGLFNFTVAKVYWSAFEERQGQPRWEEVDKLLAWAHSHGLTVKGHPLVWTHPDGTPSWVLALPDNVATSLLEARTRNLVGGYQGRVDMWDVVNEPVNTVPWDWAMRDPANSDWEILSGSRYDVSKVTTADILPSVGQAFTWAAEANPRGHFILNDFFLFAKPDVRARFHTLVAELLKRGVPVGGLGIQAHEPREMWFSPEEITKTLDLLAEFKLPLHITEFIPQSGGKPIEGWRAGAWTPEAQAEFAEQVYTLCFGHPAVESINWWSFSDRDTWLEAGGLVDKDLNPKPVYLRLKALIRGAWMTREENLLTDETGRVRFRGFHGKYRVEVAVPSGPSKNFEIHVQKDEANDWQFEL